MAKENINLCAQFIQKKLKTRKYQFSVKCQYSHQNMRQQLYFTVFPQIEKRLNKTNEFKVLHLSVASVLHTFS